MCQNQYVSMSREGRYPLLVKNLDLGFDSRLLQILMFTYSSCYCSFIIGIRARRVGGNLYAVVMKEQIIICWYVDMRNKVFCYFLLFYFLFFYFFVFIFCIFVFLFLIFVFDYRPVLYI